MLQWFSDSLNSLNSEKVLLYLAKTPLEHDKKDLKVTDLQANAKLAKKGEHQTRMAEVPSSILTEHFVANVFYFTRESLWCQYWQFYLVCENLEGATWTQGPLCESQPLKT